MILCPKKCYHFIGEDFQFQEEHLLIVHLSVFSEVVFFFSGILHLCQGVQGYCREMLAKVRARRKLGKAYCNNETIFTSTRTLILQQFI